MNEYRTPLARPVRLGALILTIVGTALVGGCTYISDHVPEVRMPDVRLPVVPGAASDSDGPPAPSPGEDPYAAPKSKGPLSVNSSISQIAASPKGRDVLNRDLPGLLDRPEYPMFKMMSLKRVAAMSHGQITQDTLDKTAADLAALAHSAAAPDIGSNAPPATSADPH